MYSKPSTHSCFRIFPVTEAFPEPFGPATIRSFGFSIGYKLGNLARALSYSRLRFSLIIFFLSKLFWRTSASTSFIIVRSCCSVGSVSLIKRYEFISVPIIYILLCSLQSYTLFFNSSEKLIYFQGNLRIKLCSKACCRSGSIAQ